MSFVVNGAEWTFNGWSAKEVVDAIDSLLGRIDKTRRRGETVWIGDDLQIKHMFGEFDLWSLCSPSSPIKFPPEMVQELAGWLGTAPRYLDEQDWPNGMDDILVQIDNESPEVNADLAWAHHCVRGGKAVACLSLKEATIRKTTTTHGTATIHFVNDEYSHRFFWRDAFNVEGDTESTLRRLAAHAFPDLYLVNRVWDGLGDLGGGYLAARSEIRKYLIALDDYGAWVYTCPPPALAPRDVVIAEVGTKPSNQIIERRFIGLNLDMAPEKPNVYGDEKCRTARQVTVKDRTLYCEWHGKLEPHRNRLHIHPPVPQSDNKLVIAIFHEHLPLP